MDIRSRIRAGAYAFALATGFALVAPPLPAQEPSGGKPADPSPPPAAKKSVDPSRRVPPLFGQVGLTPEQKEEIYKIRARRQAQIDALHKQLTQLHAEVISECESVLSDSQKKLLTLRRDAAARAKASKSPTAATPVSSKAEGKAGN